MRPARLLFVGFHLFAISWMALPSAGGGMNRSAWKSGTVQGEFRTWVGRLNRIGVDITVPELEDVLWDFARRYEKGKQWVLDPMRPYLTTTGSEQSWRMFVAPHRYPGRLVIELDHGDGFVPIYMARSNEHTWRRSVFDHDRMRAAVFRYAWPHFKGPRHRFTEWVAREVAEEFPEAERVRVSFLRYRTPSPEEVRAGEEPPAKQELANMRRLQRYRAAPP